MLPSRINTENMSLRGRIKQLVVCAKNPGFSGTYSLAFISSTAFRVFNEAHFALIRSIAIHHTWLDLASSDRAIVRDHAHICSELVQISRCIGGLICR